MKHYNAIFIMVTLAFLCTSCDKEPESSIQYLGEVEYYDDFLFYKSKPAEFRITKLLKFDFNDDAQASLQPIVFELIEKNADGIVSVPRGLTFYINDIKQDDNTFNIKTSDKQVFLGVEFEKLAYEGNHRLFLRVKNGGELDYIDNTEISPRQSDIEISTQTWDVYKKDIMNPLKKRMLWALAIIGGLLVILFLIVRANHPTFRIRTLRIEYYTPEGELRPPYQRIILKGCYKVICTNKKPKQSIIARIFKGKIAFVINDLWDKEMCLLPKSFSKNTIRIAKNPYNSFVKSIEKGEVAEFENSNNEKAIFNT